MKKLNTLSCLFLFFISFVAQAQDEGTVEVKDRFERDKTIYFSIGPAFTLGKNLDEYGIGANIDVGYLKRMNQFLSLGPSLSYLSFAYDDTKGYPYFYSLAEFYSYITRTTGGNLNLLSAGVNLKLNFLPVNDNTIFSAYATVNPFVSYVNRGDVTVSSDLYYDGGSGYTDVYDGTLTSTSSKYPALASDSKITGGVHLGVGIEFHPAKKISFFAQATYNYVLPITYVSTQSFLYPKDILPYSLDAANNVYYEASENLFLDEFPVVKKSLNALSISVGMAFNF